MVKAIQTLPVPAFYNASHAFDPVYRISPDAIRRTALEYRNRYNIAPASDGWGITLVSIDNQDDFNQPWGGLFVGDNRNGGPLADGNRLAEFQYRNAAIINATISTGDAHDPLQISCPASHLDCNGNFAPTNINITAAMIESGEYRPNPDIVAMLKGGRDYRWLKDYWLYYARTLETTKLVPLRVWSEHCPSGGPGQSIIANLHEARIFIAYLRGRNPIMHWKGRTILTEEYSPFEPVILLDHNGCPLTESDPHMERELEDDAAILDFMFRQKGPKVFAGQANGFCLSAAVDTWLAAAAKRDPSQIGQTYVLKDCTSPVVVCDGNGKVIVDFTPLAEAQTDKFVELGAHVVNSTDPIETWPGIQLAA